MLASVYHRDHLVRVVGPLSRGNGLGCLDPLQSGKNRATN